VADLTPKQRYKKTPKGRATAARYKQSTAGQAAGRRTRAARKKRDPTYMARAARTYRQTEKGKKARQAWVAGPGKLVNLKSWLKQTYDMTLEHFWALVAYQDNKCALCGLAGEKQRHKRLYVDHDHTSGAIRGLLCERCNLWVGVWEKLPHERIRGYLSGRNNL
jgi:hypothetical protein